jgi:LPXTG-site transpeptidase (sortase) family protein
LRLLILILVVAGAALGAAAGAGAVQPPNKNDPCAKAGRDVCGTTAIGFYKTYRYGLRWFGDYTDVVPGIGTSFCIDLGYWYPSAKDRYVLDRAAGLRTTTGHAVSLLNREKIAYAIWAYGRSSEANHEAAVMLYVHSLMGDARPGEVDASAISSDVASLDEQIATSAARYHGPYRIVSGPTGALEAGRQTSATVRVLSAVGFAVPGVTLTLEATGASGLPKTVTTDARGLAPIDFRPTATHGVAISVRTGSLASTLPTVYQPSAPSAAANAQRIVTPASQHVERTVIGHVVKAHIAVTTAARPSQQVSGHVVRDHVTIAGATPSWHARVTVTIDGPYPSNTQIDCTKKAWNGTFTTSGPGVYTTPVATVRSPGWYVFQLRVPGDLGNVGLRTPCDDPAERFFVQAQPTLTTVASSGMVAPGTAIFDRVAVGSLAGTSVTAVVDLFGPFASSTAISCGGAPIWSGSISAKANGTYKTASFTPTVPGVYAYRARIDSTDLIRGTQNGCGEQTETTTVSGTPKVDTRASTAQVRPGTQITDELDVSGTGALVTTVTDELFGPFETRAGINCSGTPIWTGTVATKGDGTYTTRPVTIQKVGYYVFHESIPATPQSAAVNGKCGEAAETTIASSRPVLTTLSSSDVVRPGSALSDHIDVSGLGQTQAAIQVQLYGPFATKSEIRCTGKPTWQTLVTAKGDGKLRTPQVHIAKAGFYVFHETLVARDLVASVSTDCADTAETSLGAPAIITGRGDVTRVIAARPVPDAPTRIEIPSLGIDAPVIASGIDIAKGVLGVPANIHETGWWADGAVPGDATGSVIIAGHVDSAKAGAGAFFPLQQARRGTMIEVATNDGKTKTYKVVSVRTMLKERLPTDIWSQKGPNHLVVVTCGGPFDHATGHYRDNVVVTAVPA